MRSIFHKVVEQEVQRQLVEEQVLSRGLLRQCFTEWLPLVWAGRSPLVTVTAVVLVVTAYLTLLPFLVLIVYKITLD